MILLRWLVSALAFLALSQLIPGISVASFGTALILALLWGVVNITIKPILLLLTLPFNILTLGIFTFIINGFLLWMLGGLVKGFEVHGFWVAVLGALFLSVVSSVSHWALSASVKNDD